MNEHVTAVLERIDLQIGKLQEFRRLTVEFGEILEGGSPSPRSIMEVANSKLVDGGTTTQRYAITRPRPARTGRAVSAKTLKVTGGRGEKLLEQARAVGTLLGAFGADDVAMVAKVDKKTAQNFNTQACLKGWIKREGFGKYKRTAKFPGANCAPKGGGGGKTAPLTPAAGNAGRLQIPGIDVPLGTLEERIEKALLDRDAARAKGNDSMAQVYQDKVDKLQRELDGQ